MKEVWRDIPGYEGLYQVSNLGRIKSFKRDTVNGKILKLILKRDGYLRFNAYKNGKCKYLLIHRCVAKAFISNPHSYSEINHKNENKQDNRVSNLEWCSAKYNSNYGTRNERIAHLISKPVLQLTLDGQLIKRWSSAAECGRHGFKQGHVAECCKGEHKTHHGYKWRYEKVGD